MKVPWYIIGLVSFPTIRGSATSINNNDIPSITSSNQHNPHAIISVQSYIMPSIEFTHIFVIATVETMNQIVSANILKISNSTKLSNLIHKSGEDL